MTVWLRPQRIMHSVLSARIILHLHEAGDPSNISGVEGITGRTVSTMNFQHPGPKRNRVVALEDSLFDSSTIEAQTVAAVPGDDVELGELESISFADAEVEKRGRRLVGANPAMTEVNLREKEGV